MLKVNDKEDRTMFEVDFSDLKACRKLMLDYGLSTMPYGGKNKEGEPVLINVYPDHITVYTSQKNGWLRINTIWKDGTTEEMFEKR